MQAIILAAGMGKRLKELTSEATKCMVKVNGVAMIDRMMGHLDKLGLSRIVVVVGYEGQKLMDYIDALGVSTPIVYVDNNVYNKTNNIYSLYLAISIFISGTSSLFSNSFSGINLSTPSRVTKLTGSVVFLISILLIFLASKACIG